MNIKIDFSNELLIQIKTKVSILKISEWAYDFFQNNCRSIDKSFEYDIMKIVSIQEGDEFELTYDELKDIANKYINYND